MPELVEPTWRVAGRTTSANGGPRIEHVAHAVRNGYTLCGYAESRIDWLLIDPRVSGCCQFCGSVPVGAATSRDLLEFGLTYRQIDYWCSRGYLKPDEANPGSGQRRVFPAEEVAVAIAMLAYMSVGLTVEGANRAAHNNGWLSPEYRVVRASAEPQWQDGT